MGKFVKLRIFKSYKRRLDLKILKMRILISPKPQGLTIPKCEFFVTMRKIGPKDLIIKLDFRVASIKGLTSCKTIDKNFKKKIHNSDPTCCLDKKIWPGTHHDQKKKTQTDKKNEPDDLE